jgi:hypothetical protein
LQLLSEHWWSRQFPEAEVRLSAAEPTQASWRLREAGWTTETTVTAFVTRHDSNWFLTICHQGWEEVLPPTENIAARKRYAQLWRVAFELLERV